MSRRVAVWRRTLCRCAVGAVISCGPVARAGEPTAHPAASEALALCDEADQVAVAERSAVLAHGLARAEGAARENPDDAVAHFAVFCNLGKMLRMKQGGCGLFTALGELDRAREEIDLALTL